MAQKQEWGAHRSPNTLIDVNRSDWLPMFQCPNVSSLTELMHTAHVPQFGTYSNVCVCACVCVQMCAILLAYMYICKWYTEYDEYAHINIPFRRHTILNSNIWTHIHIKTIASPWSWNSPPSWWQTPTTSRVSGRNLGQLPGPLLREFSARNLTIQQMSACTECTYDILWSMGVSGSENGVLYNIRPHFVGIFPCIGLT